MIIKIKNNKKNKFLLTRLLSNMKSNYQSFRIKKNKNKKIKLTKKNFKKKTLNNKSKKKKKYDKD